jgi:hypothetical protein
MALDPVSLAILGGLQLAAGAAGGVSNYMKADVMSDDEKDRLKQLQREQELGMLGFSPGELQDVRQAVVNPMAAMEKQQQDQLKATMAAQQAGAGDAFRVALGAQESQRRVRAGQEDKVQQQNLIEKQREEQQILQLAAKDKAVEAAKKAAIIEAVTGGIVAGGSFAVKAADYMESTTPSEDVAITVADEAQSDFNSMRDSGYFGETQPQQMSQLGGVPSGPNQNMTAMSYQNNDLFGFANPFQTRGEPFPAMTRPDGTVVDQYGNPIDPNASLFLNRVGQ